MNKSAQYSQSLRKYRQAITAIRLLLEDYEAKKDDLSAKEIFEYAYNYEKLVVLKNYHFSNLNYDSFIEGYYSDLEIYIHFRKAIELFAIDKLIKENNLKEYNFELFLAQNYISNNKVNYKLTDKRINEISKEIGINKKVIERIIKNNYSPSFLIGSINEYDNPSKIIESIDGEKEEEKSILKYIYSWLSKYIHHSLYGNDEALNSFHKNVKDKLLNATFKEDFYNQLYKDDLKNIKNLDKLESYDYRYFINATNLLLEYTNKFLDIRNFLTLGCNELKKEDSLKVLNYASVIENFSNQIFVLLITLLNSYVAKEYEYGATLIKTSLERMANYNKIFTYNGYIFDDYDYIIRCKEAIYVGQYNFFIELGKVTSELKVFDEIKHIKTHVAENLSKLYKAKTKENPLNLKEKDYINALMDNPMYFFYDKKELYSISIRIKNFINDLDNKQETYQMFKFFNKKTFIKELNDAYQHSCYLNHVRFNTLFEKDIDYKKMVSLTINSILLATFHIYDKVASNIEIFLNKVDISAKEEMLNIILLKGVKEKELSDLFLYVTNYLDELPSDFDDSYIKDIIEYMEENKS